MQTPNVQLKATERDDLFPYEIILKWTLNSCTKQYQDANHKNLLYVLAIFLPFYHIY